jgi:hypothetical protein
VDGGGNGAPAGAGGEEDGAVNVEENQSAGHQEQNLATTPLPVLQPTGRNQPFPETGGPMAWQPRLGERAAAGESGMDQAVPLGGKGNVRDGGPALAPKEQQIAGLYRCEGY